MLDQKFTGERIAQDEPIKTKEISNEFAILEGQIEVLSLNVGKLEEKLCGMINSQNPCETDGESLGDIKNIKVEVATVSGMNDTDRAVFWKEIKKLKGRCIEFKAQQKTKGRYRHPRYLRLRNDKNSSECIF